KKMWDRIAGFFGIESAPYPGKAQPLAETLAGVGADWSRIVEKYNLKPNPVERIAPWWHVDADLSRTQECVTDMTRSRLKGFLEYRSTWLAFQDLFERLRGERIIP